ncbi:MAG: hypothetical protein SAL70_22080 [Scytonema sp. PMC 1070.18]|nr:hypothetical protein [Scytonema sp. PMC 1070.18]
MLTVGDIAIHQKTGELGTVIGYGHELVDNAYQTTLKVLISNQDDSDQTNSTVKEDLYSAWKKTHGHDGQVIMA